MTTYETAPNIRPILIIVMGPASCGKSTIGQNLAKDLSIPFIDGDSLHPETNVSKMSSGIPLTDEDRLPWLQTIRQTAEVACKKEWEAGRGTYEHQEAEIKKGQLGRPAVAIACSALTKYYRDILRGQAEVLNRNVPTMRTLFVYCKGTPEVLTKRIEERKNHFMKPSMLASQLATLEDPSEEQGVVTVDIDQAEKAVAKAAREGILTIIQAMGRNGQ